MSGIAPLAVFDVAEDNWNRLPSGQQEDVRAWARTEGLDLSDVTRLEIHVIDCPLARVTAHARDEDGGLVINEAGDTIVQQRPYDVLIRSMPPHMPGNPTREGPEGNRG